MKTDICKYGEFTQLNKMNLKGIYTFDGWTTNSNGVPDNYYWTGWSGNWVYTNGNLV